MTSAVKRVDQSVFLTAKSIKEGKFKGGTDHVFNMKNHGVAVGSIDARVPKRFITRMNALKPLMIHEDQGSEEALRQITRDTTKGGPR